MRILHTLAQYPAITGSGVYAANLIQALQSFDGVEQALIYGRNREQKPTSLSIQTYPVIFDREPLNFPLPGMSDVMPYPSTPYRELIPPQRQAWMAAFSQTLEVAVKTFKPDLLLCHHLWLLTALCQRMSLPMITCCHGTDLRQAQQNPDFFREVVGDLSGLDPVFALTYAQVNDLEQVYDLTRSQVIVAGSGYDPVIFHFSPDRLPGATVRFIYAGRISHPKGTWELLEAFRGLPPELNVSLSLVGGVPDQDRARLTAAMAQDPRISWQDSVAQAELGELLRQHDIFVFPSYYEGLGLSALEALACGLDLVVNDLPALASFLGEKVWSQEHLHVIEMPVLNHLDLPSPEALPGYTQALRQALADAAKQFRNRHFQKIDLSPALAPYTWHGLAQNLLQVGQTLL